MLKLINAAHLLWVWKSGDHILKQYLEWLYRLVSDRQFKVLKFINMTNSRLDWKVVVDVRVCARLCGRKLFWCVEVKLMDKVSNINAICNCLDKDKLSRVIFILCERGFQIGKHKQLPIINCEFRTNSSKNYQNSSNIFSNHLFIRESLRLS